MKSTIIAAAAIVMLVCAGAAGAGPRDLLPGNGSPEGWRKDGEALIFTPENLWEYINGQAEAFLMYDFKEVAAQHYLGGADLEIKIEIYEHGSPLMAFGIYTQFRSPDGAYLKIGNEAFGDEYSLHFWKGRYYVKVQAYEEGPESADAMREFALLAASAISESGEEPPETALFPRGGLIEKSVTYVTEGAMGSGKLPPAFTGEYAVGEEKGKMYIFPLESAKSAEEYFSWYTGELGAQAKESEAAGTRFVSASGEAPYRGHVRIFRYGRFMGILTGFAEGSEAGDSIVGSAAALMAGECARKK